MMRYLTIVKEVLRPYYLRWLYFRFVRGSRPPYFAECWRYPNVPLAEVSSLISDRPGDLSDRATVVIYPMSDWHARTQRPQQFARELANLGHDVIYLNLHFGRQFEKVFLRDSHHRVSRLQDKIFELHVRLTREPVFHHRLLRASEAAAVASAVGQLADVLGARRVVQLVALPTWMGAAVKLRESRNWPLIYDCHDFLPELPKMAEEIITEEGPDMKRADLVLYASRWLLEYHGRQGVDARSVLLRNGANSATRAAAQQVEKVPVVVGYVGAVSEWFDVDAMYSAAKLNEDVEFVVAGSVENQQAFRLTELPNVRLIGEVSAEDVPDLLAKFTVGLIPFLVNNLTLAANPIKLYEYFSYGLPVVSSRLPEVENHLDLVYLATGPNEFATQVEQALSERDVNKRRSRAEVAQQATWARRAIDLSVEIESLSSSAAPLVND